jgi:protein-disulfide isomerase
MLAAGSGGTCFAVAHSRTLGRWGILLLTVFCLGLTAAAQAEVGTSVVGGSPAKLSPLSLAGIPQHNEILGNPHAPLRLLYFDDPQCPYCLEWHDRVLPTLLRRYVRSGELQIQWHGFAVVGPDSVVGLRFVAAAGLQDRLWDVLDDLFANQGEENSGWLRASLLEEIGASIAGFNLPSAVADASSPAVTSELAVDERLARRDGIEGVPTVLIGLRGRRLTWLEGSDLTPPAYERTIGRLLRTRHKRAPSPSLS